MQSALDGYHVCLFSYGQTGSGKTYTMQGTGRGQMRGIIPRSMEQGGEYQEKLERDGWKYEMEVSFLEVYNETIRDLLSTDPFNNNSVHPIKTLPDGHKYVSNLTILPVNPHDREKINYILSLAAKHRSVGSTSMNKQSSRTHSVFTLNLTACHRVHKQTFRGTLNLVDLAGSERLDRSHTVG